MSQQPPWERHSRQDHFPAHVQQHIPPQWQNPSAPKPRRKANWGRRIVWLFILAGGLTFGLATAFSSSKPPTPFQQCVTSIQQQGPGQVIGYTPQCMALTVSQRNAAIRQATGNG